MKSHWHVSTHLAERLMERTDNPKQIMRDIKKVLRDRCLELIFECLVKGNQGRFYDMGNGFKFPYKFDDRKKILVVPTIYRSFKERM